MAWVLKPRIRWPRAAGSLDRLNLIERVSYAGWKFDLRVQIRIGVLATEIVLRTDNGRQRIRIGHIPNMMIFRGTRSVPRLRIDEISRGRFQGSHGGKHRED